MRPRHGDCLDRGMSKVVATTFFAALSYGCAQRSAPPVTSPSVTTAAVVARASGSETTAAQFAPTPEQDEAATSAREKGRELAQARAQGCVPIR
jgi:hypothetical protein